MDYFFILSIKRKCYCFIALLQTKQCESFLKTVKYVKQFANWQAEKDEWKGC